MTKIIFLFIGILIIGSWYGAVLRRKIAVSDALISHTRLFTKDGNKDGISILVLGDSTAVGVGASRPEDTVAARLATEVGAIYVENHAKSGAVVSDLMGQIELTTLPEYSYILIEIGGNDIIRFRSAKKAGESLDHMFQRLPKADHLIVHSAGNVGAATFFPWFIRPFHTKLNLEYHAVFEDVARRHGATYVNLYEDPARDPFVRQPKVYLSADGLHPSSLGYALWFEKIRAAL